MHSGRECKAVFNVLHARYSDAQLFQDNVQAHLTFNDARNRVFCFAALVSCQFITHSESSLPKQKAACAERCSERCMPWRGAWRNAMPWAWLCLVGSCACNR